jgi:hypothetical protein
VNVERFPSGCLFAHPGIGAILLTTILACSMLKYSAPAHAASSDPIDTMDEPFWWVPSTARTDGTTIVWDKRESVPQGDYSTDSRDVFAARVADSQPFPVAVGDIDQRFPDVSDGIVVWLEDNLIRAKNLASDETFDVGTTGDPLPKDVGGYDREWLLSWRAPSISGTWVVWITLSGQTAKIMARNITTMAQPVTVAEGGVIDAGNDSVRPAFATPQISGERIMWIDLSNGSAGAWPLMSGTVFGDEVRKVLNLPTEQFDFANDLVTFGTKAPDPDKRDAIAIYHLDTGEKTLIVDAPNAGPFKSPPATDGRFVFWGVETGLGGTWIDYRLSGYDTISESQFTTDIDALNLQIDLDGGIVAITNGHVGRYGISIASVANLLPSAPQPAPATTSPDWTYYPDTGHYLSSGFRDFWTQNGGLPVFGYPLTEEFSQHGLTVQYLERQRFEYHPEFAGTPYEVELGRLGAEDAEQRGLNASQPFQPLQSSTTTDANCTFFAQTGHRLCFGFKTYWQSHGMEFGDEGVSYREALALFGYPISEEFIDPATGYTVQYFERARFEFHPENPEPYRVLLGRLGAVVLDQQFK